MNKRVVITGLGAAAPNGVGIAAFTDALKKGTSGIVRDAQLERLAFSCQISGTPEISDTLRRSYFTELELRGFASSGILYGVVAGMEAWSNAGLDSQRTATDWDSGAIFGAGTSGVDKFRESIYRVDQMETRRLGSTVVSQIMTSGISAYLAGKLGLGNQVSTNSAACTTGTESVLMAYERIKNGQARRMLAGSTSDSGPYIWAGFDAMRICAFNYNHMPEKGSRPMSASATGIVPAGGAGAIILEELEEARARGAKIYGEILGGALNSGGQRNGGSMTAPNSLAVRRCITGAIANAGIIPADIDAVNGHLTGTAKDALEIQNWTQALQRKGDNFPYINSLKAMTGHCLSASGSLEIVASLLQLDHGFIFPSLNCEDLHPVIADLVPRNKIPLQKINADINIIAKASFGFGDVNACIILKKFKDE